jgi:hypothetical protein
VRRNLPYLRQRHLFEVLRAAFRASNRRADFRMVHYSVQSNHLHLLCEADDARALGRGMQGLAIRTALALNRRLGRKGSVFDDRYFAREQTCPLQVRRTLVYIFGNASHHGRRGFDGLVDAYSSAAHFDGWARPLPSRVLDDAGEPVGQPSTTWLLRTGWRRHGALRFGETPT